MMKFEGDLTALIELFVVVGENGLEEITPSVSRKGMRRVEVDEGGTTALSITFRPRLDEPGNWGLNGGPREPVRYMLDNLHQ